MVEETGLMGIIATYGDFALNIGILFISLLIILGLAVGSFFVLRWWLRYRTEVYYFYNDGHGNTRIGRDKGGIFAKFKMVKFWLRGHKIGTDPDKLKLIDINNKKSAFFIKKGEKSFRPINFNIDTNLININVGEEDVNWAITELQIQSKRFDFRNWFQQYGAIFLWVIFGLFTLILIIQLMKNFEVFKAVAQNFKDAVVEMVKLETLKNGGGII